MISANKGWTFSYDGIILQYNGDTWQIADSLKNIWENVSPGDTLFATTKNIGDIYAIRMLNSNRGWMAVNNPDARLHLLFQYRDRKWEVLNQTFPIKIRALDFANGQGWAVGQRGILQWKDGKWQPESLPVSANLRSVQISPSGRVWVCGGYATLLSYNGRWEKIPMPASVLLRDLDFINDDEGWLVGNNGTLWHYKEGSIEQVQDVTSANLWAVDMIDSLTGWVVGENGVILQCRNGEWLQAESPTTADLHDIEMLNSTDGWIIGAWGTILHFSPEAELPQLSPRRFQFVGQVHIGSDNLMDRISDVSGVLTADFNGDNRTDIYLTCLRSLNHLLLNRGGGYYVDAVIESGTGGNIENRVGAQRYERGALAADFDRDGDQDIFLFGNSRTLRLFVNNGKALFTDFTDRSGIPRNFSVQAALLGDFDENGYPDILLSEMQEGAVLLLNKKYNQFSRQSILLPKLPAYAIQIIAVSDINFDGHPDVLLFFQDRQVRCLLNNGKAHFQPDSILHCPRIESSFINSATFFDADNDGDNDLFLASEDGRDAFWINSGDSTTGEIHFHDRSQQWGIVREGRSYSAVAGDFNHDGFVDLYLSRFGQDILYLNRDGTHFINQSETGFYSKAKFNSGFNTGAARLDIDQDGDLDLIVGNRNYWSSLLQNTQNDSAYLLLHLKGVESNPDAIGSKIRIYRPGKPHSARTLLGYREISGGSGYFSQNSRAVHFGVPVEKFVDLEICFPGGKRKSLENLKVPANLIIYEDNATIRLAHTTVRSVLTTLHKPFIRIELLKFFIFAIIIIFSVKFFERRYKWRFLYLALYLITVMGVYGVFTITAPATRMGAAHLFPFAFILLILTTLVAINEQTYKSLQRKKYLKRRLSEARARISGATLLQPAIDVVSTTIRNLVPVEKLIIYLFNEVGNLFVAKKHWGFRLKTEMKVLKIGRKDIQKLLHQSFPFPLESATFELNLSPFNRQRSLIFPIVSKREIQGLIILESDESVPVPDSETLETINSLCFHFALTIKNLRLVKLMDDHKKMAAIGTFAGGIIHDLKNPIDGLRLITEVLLNETPANDPRYEYVRELYDGILRMKSDLLNSFNVVNKRADLQSNIDINRKIKEIVGKDSFPLNLLHLELAEEIPRFPGNEAQITFAIENIIRNAFEATGTSGKIEIRTAYHARQNTIVLEVSDNGTGISVDELEKIFDMFYSTKNKGRGLGLTITRNIIENHGGKITIDTTQGVGSSVKIYFPLQKT